MQSRENEVVNTRNKARRVPQKCNQREATFISEIDDIDDVSSSFAFCSDCCICSDVFLVVYEARGPPIDMRSHTHLAHARSGLMAVCLQVSIFRSHRCFGPPPINIAGNNLSL